VESCEVAQGHQLGERQPLAHDGVFQNFMLDFVQLPQALSGPDSVLTKMDLNRLSSAMASV